MKNIVNIFYWIFVMPYTFYWVGAVGAGAKLLGGIMGKRSADKGASNTKKIEAQNLKMINDEETETLRRMDYTQEQVMGQSNASIAASGIANSGSTADYLAALEANYGNERSWVQKQTQSQRDQNKLDSQTKRDALRNEGNSALIGGVAGAASWWDGGFGSKKPKTIPKSGISVDEFVGGNY